MKEKILLFIRKNKLFFAILGFVFLVYFPSLNNQLFWDDEQFIYNNAYVKNFQVDKIFSKNTLAGAGENSNYYRPLTTLSFAIDHLFWGLNPIGYHLTNTIMHLVAGVLLFVILKELGMKEAASAVIAGIFMLHPIQTEAVVYANSRGDSFYTLLMFAGILSMVYAIKKKKYTLNLYNLSYTFSTWFFAILIPIFLFLSILAKEIALGSILLYLVVFLYLVGKNLSQQVPAITGLGLSLGALAMYGGLRMTVLKFMDSLNAFAGTSYGESLVVRLATFAKVFLLYIALLLFPNNLHMERTTTVVESPFTIYTLSALIFLALMIGLAWHEKKKVKTGWIGFGLAWFLAMLAPVSGVLPLNDIMYEHWLYVPMIGFFILVYGVLTLVFAQFKRQWPTYTKYLVGILFAIYAVMTIRQNYIWGKATRFYPYILKYQETARVHNNLAMAYADEQNLDKAIEHYKKATEISDVYPQTHYNLARSYAASGNDIMAIQEFKTTLEMSPNFGPAYPSLLQMLIKTQQIQEARQYFDLFSEQFPDAPILNELEMVLKRLEAEQ